MTPPKVRSSGERAASWVLFILALALAVVVVGRRSSAQRAAPGDRQSPLALVPVGPRLLVSADVAGLARVAGSDILRAGGDKLLGLGELCGVEPLLLVQHAVFAMPFGQGGQKHGGDFALIAQTTLEPNLGLHCAELVIKQRGGKPGWSKRGGFTSVRDVEKPLGEVAMRRDGMFVLSGGQYFRDVMDAAEGAAVTTDQAARLRNELHQKIRERLGAPQLTITLLPDDSLPLPGIQALGLGLQVQRELILRGFVGCASAAACSEARQLIEATKADLAAEPGLGELAATTVSERNGSLEIAGRLPRNQLATLLKQLFAP